MNRFLSFFSPTFTLPRKGRTVRYMFPAIVSVVAVLGAAVATTTPEMSYVRLQVSDSVVEAGSRITLEVYAYAHEPVNAVDITLHFDEDVVEVLEIDRGQSVLTIWTEDPKAENGTVLLRGGTYRKGFVNEHLIASIDLRAKIAGEGSFSAEDVMLLAGDGAGTPVTTAEADDSSLSLYVYDESSTPDSIDISLEVQVVTDLDGDGNVSLKDVSAFMGAWHSKSRVYDFNNDGRMTFRDFSIILADVFRN
jgi:hypothetical protein